MQTPFNSNFTMSYFYVATLNGQLEYATNSLNHFLDYQLVYEEEHCDENVEYLLLTEDEYFERFGVEDDEE